MSLLFPFLSLALFSCCMYGSLRLKVFCVCWWGTDSNSSAVWLRCCSASAWRLLRFIHTDQSERSAATLTSSPYSFDSLFWSILMCSPHALLKRTQNRTPHNGSVLPTNNAVIVVLLLWFRPTDSTEISSSWQL